MMTRRTTTAANRNRTTPIWTLTVPMSACRQALMNSESPPMNCHCLMMRRLVRVPTNPGSA